MSQERPAEEIRAGDVIEYAPGGLMLVTQPGRPETIQYVGKRVCHHGMILTVPEHAAPGSYAPGKAMDSGLRTPREKVMVHQRLAYQLGDGCPCDYHRKARGEHGPAQFPPAVQKQPGEEVASVGRSAGVDAPVTTSAAAGPGRSTRRRRGGPLTRPAARPAVPVSTAEPATSAVSIGAPAGYRLAVAVAPLLGEGWSAQGPQYEGREAGFLVHADGRRLMIRPDTQLSQRDTHVLVTVQYPDGAPVRVDDVDCPQTRFRHDRPVAALVDAIRAKILPAYDARYPQIKALTHQYRAALATGESLAARLAGMVPGAKARDGDSLTVVASPVPGEIEKITVRVSADEGLHQVRFEWVDSATLEALVQTYAEMVAAKTQRRAGGRARGGVGVPAWCADDRDARKG